MLSRLFVAAALVLFCGRAHAQEGDGVYGRFDASTSVVLGAGAAITFDDASVGALIDARVRILESGGVFASFHTETPGRARLFTGIELRPLFPALFLQDLSTGRAYLDLFLQSLSIELGVDLGLERDGVVGFAWGLSLEVPLLTPERFAHGLGLRVGIRRSTAFVDGRPSSGLAQDLETFSGFALLALGLDAGSGSAGWEPPRHRPR